MGQPNSDYRPSALAGFLWRTWLSGNVVSERNTALAVVLGLGLALSFAILRRRVAIDGAGIRLLV